MVRRKTAGAWSSVCWVPLSNPEASSLFLVRASRLFLVRAPRLFLVRASRLFLGPVLLFPGFNMLIRCLLPCVVLIYAFVLPLCCLVRSWSCATTVYAVYMPNTRVHVYIPDTRMHVYTHTHVHVHGYCAYPHAVYTHIHMCICARYPTRLV